jgi:REP element-mobilizing transposase RayT
MEKCEREKDSPRERGAPGCKSAETDAVEDGRAPGKRRLWQADYWDRFIRDAQHYANTVEYIHGNPVRAGLVKSPAEWPWSSAAGR